MSDESQGRTWPWSPANGDAPLSPVDAAAGLAEGEIAALFARCFRGGDGDRLIRHLRTLTIDRRAPPHMAGRELRHLEGQRHLAAYIIAMVARGRRGT